jgi:hypothetical protein
MLEGRQALDLALELARMPTLAAAMRRHPLPPDVLVVIRVAAGCPDTSREVARLTGLGAASAREACVLYLQQILLARDADSYRVLGVARGAPRKQMREHMRWLLKWLHPDRNQDEWESVFAERVLKAWRDLGSSSVPAQTSAGERFVRGSTTRARRRRPIPAQRWVALPLPPVLASSSWTRKRVLAVTVGVVGLAVALALAFSPA